MLTAGGLRVYTTEDVKTTLKCSKSHAYKLMHEKHFPTIKIGRRLYVLEDEFKKYLTQNTGKCIIV